jgi:hypothetical protein
VSLTAAAQQRPATGKSSDRTGTGAEPRREVALPVPAFVAGAGAPAAGGGGGGSSSSVMPVAVALWLLFQVPGLTLRRRTQRNRGPRSRSDQPRGRPG